MEVLGREIPDNLAKLHDEVVNLRPDATLRFTKGLSVDFPSLAWHIPDNNGNSEVRLAENFTDAALAHELLHVMLYRRGFPYASPLSVFGSHTLTARALNCCVSHASLSEEVADLGVADFWPPPALGSDEDITPLEDRIVQAWNLAEAGDDNGDEPQVAGLAARFRDAIEKCRQPGATRWRRTMIDLLQYMDGLEKREEGAFGPLRSVLVTLVVTEPQLTRPADRMVELTPLGGESIGFVHKQDGGLFHYRFATPGRKRREMAELQTELKKTRTETFLDQYWVPYTVDLRVKK
jgi:hypothetical protein